MTTLEQSLRVAEPAPRRTASQPRAYVPELDALRCLAMTAVVLQHCDLLPCGWTGVWLFFVISGFAITTSLQSAEAASRSRGHLINDFLIRRALRIWPLYFGFLALMTPVAWLTAAHGYFIDLPALLTFTYNYWIAGHGDGWSAVGHLWSISVEQQFYLVFPFLFAFLAPTARIRTLWAITLLSPLLLAVVALSVGRFGWSDEAKAQALYMFGPAHFSAFALGALIALNRRRIEGATRMAWRLLMGAMVVSVLYAATFAMLNALHGRRGWDVVADLVSGVLWGDGREILIYPLVTIIAAAIVFAVLAGLPPLKRLCTLPGLQAAGRISYGAYVLHAPIVFFIAEALPHWRADWDASRQLLLFALAYPLTLLVAGLSHRHLERRFLTLQRRAA